MKSLTVEMLQQTPFQAVLELKGILEEHPGMPLTLIVEDETVQFNLAKFLDKQGRNHRMTRNGRLFTLDVEAGNPPRTHAPTVQTQLTPLPLVSTGGQLPVLLLHSALSPGDRGLGRRLLLDLLGRVEPGTPWVCLAHDALSLLEDPIGLERLKDLEDRGIPIHLSANTLAHFGLNAESLPTPFPVMQDALWQKAWLQGKLILI